MGLDMYLYAEKYVSEYNYSYGNTPSEMSKSRNPDHIAINNASGLMNLPTDGSITVQKVVGYWRKANAIHGWFVNTLANGIDECQEIHVSRDDLRKLRDECLQVLATKPDTVIESESRTVILNGDVPNLITENIKQEQDKIANVMLLGDPLEPVAGFFFGSTEKDEWYYESLEYTVGLVENLLNADDDISFTYRASW